MRMFLFELPALEGLNSLSVSCLALTGAEFISTLVFTSVCSFSERRISYIALHEYHHYPLSISIWMCSQPPVLTWDHIRFSTASGVKDVTEDICLEILALTEADAQRVQRVASNRLAAISRDGGWRTGTNEVDRASDLRRSTQVIIRKQSRGHPFHSLTPKKKKGPPPNFPRLNRQPCPLLSNNILALSNLSPLLLIASAITSAELSLARSSSPFS